MVELVVVAVLGREEDPFVFIFSGGILEGSNA